MLSAKKPLKNKKPLSGKTTLSATKPLNKVSKKPTKQKKPMVSKLRKKADTIFSRAIRYRDGEIIEGEWIVDCITCDARKPFKAMQAGHFVKRERLFLRYDEENVNAICRNCNYYDNAGDANPKYATKLDLKYGAGTAERLKKEGKIEHQLTESELEQVIADSEEQIRWYKEQSM